MTHTSLTKGEVNEDETLIPRVLNLTPQSVSANVLSLVTACHGTKHVLVLPLRLQQVAEPLWHFLVSKTELTKPAGWQMLSKRIPANMCK